MEFYTLPTSVEVQEKKIALFSVCSKSGKMCPSLPRFQFGHYRQRFQERQYGEAYTLRPQ